MNSKEVRSYFEANGFKVIEMGIISQRKQIALLGSCNQIIVESGADSMAPSFCPPGCRIIELMPQGMVAGFASSSTQFALNHNYSRVYGKKEVANEGNISIDHDYTINIHEIRRLISTTEAISF